METLPLTVLAHEGPQVRAYLGRLRRAGLRPARILALVNPRHPVSGRPLGRWLPGGLRLRYAARVQDSLQNYWPRRLRAREPALFAAVVRGLRPLVAESEALLREMTGLFHYARYADRVEWLAIADLRDPALTRALAAGGRQAVLFTGGGILRRELLELPGLRFLHVHPGHLPQLRGADGLLWSTLLRGRPGASCFYLARGIDRGDVIAARDFPPLRFELPGGRRPDDAALYRALFSWVDPLLRAELLAELLSGAARAGTDPSALPARAQQPDAGITYHFLHEALRARALAALFRSG